MQDEQKIIILKQRKFFEKKIFTLYDDRVVIQEGRTFECRENTRYFQYFSNNRIRYSDSSKTAFAGCLFFVIILLIVIYSLRSEPALIFFQLTYLGPSILICGISYMVSRKKLLGYESKTQPIWFFEDKPSKEEFDAFLSELERRREKDLIEKFGYVDTDEAVADNLSHLYWLKKEGALTEEEYIKAKAKILDDEPSGGMAYQNRYN